MGNFDFLKAEFRDIYGEAAEAERHVIIAPRYSALLSRSAMEKAIHWLYENDADLEMPYDTHLAALMHAQCFKDILKPSMHRELDVIRKSGNNAAHGRKVNQYEALHSLRFLFRFVSFLALYYSTREPVVPAFDEALLPSGEEQEKTRQELKEITERLQEESERYQAAVAQQQLLLEENKHLKETIDAQNQGIAERRQYRQQHVPEEQVIPRLTSEAETRKLYIDLLLKEAGWENLRPGTELEYEVQGMPLSTNPTGLGYVDYVLWGDNGLPLAVVEAKQTMQDPRRGQHQASLYAECLEKMTGQRPVIFYSNGYETYIWDDTFYPPREIQGFYAKDELQLLIDRRATRVDLREFKVNTEIAGRPYQLEAVKRVAEEFVTRHEHNLRGRSRQSLLVMATGSGKTRTAAAIVDMLAKCNWAKRVLFLADRKALVTQAKRAFKDHLPHLSSIDLTREKEDRGTRLVFSTYPTIMNRINSMKSSEGRFYTTGHFDLIIIDEAHRSVYQKYGAIFDYFDSLLIGLTATPKSEIDHNTYTLFGIEDDNPTFAYELEQAVEDGFLVPLRSMEVPLKFPLEGIKYRGLSPAEKLRYELIFGDPATEGGIAEIEGRNLNKWLFNTDTVDKVLEFLMKNGLKVAGGDKLGKTIIFATNHNHALFIEKRFNKNYPRYAGGFLRVIDNQESKAQDLLERFCEDKKELDPQIAVSVDMMDTGVDAPRVLNLVFFKKVRSITKFNQMIGRGTRLRPDIFAPGMDKEYFLIFDFCDNFAYFDKQPEKAVPRAVAALSGKLFETRLEIVMLLRAKPDTAPADDELMKTFADLLHRQVQSLDEERFEVRQHWKQVKEFSIRQRWENLSKGDILDIITHLSQLVDTSKDTDEMARRFDLLMLRLQRVRLLGSQEEGELIARIAAIAGQLYEKRNIAAVKSCLEIINEAREPAFLKNADLSRMEQVRLELRGLVRLLDKDSQAPVYTDFQDQILDDKIVVRDHFVHPKGPRNYQNRVEAIINKNKHHPVINKLYNNIPIKAPELKILEDLLFQDEAGTRKEYEKIYGEQPLGAFVRSIIGLDRQVVQGLFSEFIQAGNLNADQVQFIDKLIRYLNLNGVMVDKSLLSQPPFSESHDHGIYGLFTEEEKIRQIITIIDRVNRNAITA